MDKRDREIKKVNSQILSLLLILVCAIPAMTEATPIAQWRLDDNAANATVVNSGSGGTALNGTLRTGSAESSLNTSTRHSSDRMEGTGSLNFIAASYDYVNMPRNNAIEVGNATTRQLTASAWIKSNFGGVPTGYTTVVGTGDGGWFIGSFPNENKLVFACWLTSGYTAIVTDNTPVFDGQWHFVVATFDGSKAHIYVDGNHGESPAYGGTIRNMNSKPVRISRNAAFSGSSGRYWNGPIDDVKVYDYALSAEEIYHMFNPAYAWNPHPANGAAIAANGVLTWSAGDGAVSHDVYLGTSQTAVDSAQRLLGDIDGDGPVDINDLAILAAQWLTASPIADIAFSGKVDFEDFAVMAEDWGQQPDAAFMGNQTQTAYAPGTLEADTTYYWRVDEVDPADSASPRKGRVWTFTTTVPVGRQTVYESTTNRRYVLYVPTDYDPVRAYPLIVSSHGSFQNADTEMDSTGPNSGFDNGTPTWPTLAEQYDVIVVCPDMLGAYGESACAISSAHAAELASDNTAVMAIINEVKDIYNINASKVLMTGFSGGGNTTHYIGLRHPDVFSAICARHGNFHTALVPSPLPAGIKDTPVYIFTGSSDSTCGTPEAISWYTTQGFSRLTTQTFTTSPSNVHTTDRHHALNWFLSMAFTVLPSGDTGLYNTFELEFSVTDVPDNKFTRFVSVTFTKGGQSFDIEGFYDGNDVWRARFMPNEEGSWNYTWSLAGLNSPATGSGSFTCTAKTNTKAHGHVRVDPAHSRYLVHDDGTAHYWYGGAWIMATHYGPLTKGGQTNPDTLDGFPVGRISDAEFISYLNDCETYQHNGLLLKTALFPLENDKLSWDLAWIQRGDWLVQEMAARGIYCQVNFFDTWARHKDYWFKWTWPNSGESGAQQPFNVWANGDEAAKENYIRYLVARFSGYYNVYFELGNEMEHSPNNGGAFVTQANSKYIPWYRTYDPYGLPIGLSETGIGQSANVDIVFVHQTGTFPGVSAAKPWIMNELVSGWTGGALYDDGVIRNSSNRLGYRRTFWRMFVYGGVGSSEATWLNIGNALNSAVYDVMGDQQRIREFNEALPTHINDMVTDTGFVVSGPGEKRTRSKAGQCYVTYYLGNSGAGSVSVNLPAGDYDSKWYNPSNGIYSNQTSFSHGGGNKVISYPAFSQDIVHVIVKAGS